MTLFFKLARGFQIAIIAAAVIAAALLGVVLWLKYPDHDYARQVPPLTPDQESLASELAIATRLLSETIGPRNVTYHPKALKNAAAYIESEWRNVGYTVQRQTVPSDAGPSDNLFIDVPGKDPDASMIIFGAHYDSYRHAPGANDNGTGVAALLAMARRLPQGELRWPVRLIAFTNEEPPEYQSTAMGSIYYVETNGVDRVAMMMSLETIGFYSKEADSQIYPWPLTLLYPKVGDFIGFVGDFGSRPLTTRLLEAFRRASNFPAGAVTLPDFVDGAGWSDHQAFWNKSIPAVMLTDTAIFRDPYYHTADDTVEHLDFQAVARVVSALLDILKDPAFEPAESYGFTGR